MSKYETIPTEVEAHQQQLVSAQVPQGDGTYHTAYQSDWIVRWPDGRLEVYTDADFAKKFRVPPPPYVGIRDPLRPLVDRVWPHDRPKITWTDPAMPIGPTCGGAPCSQ